MDENKEPGVKSPKESSDELLAMISKYGEENRAFALKTAKKAGDAPESAAAKSQNAENASADTEAGGAENAGRAEDAVYGADAGQAEDAGSAGSAPAVCAVPQKPDAVSFGEAAAANRGEGAAAEEGEPVLDASKHYGDGFDGAMRPVPEGGHLTDGGVTIAGQSAGRDAFSRSHFAGSDKAKKKARRAYRRAKLRNAKKKSKGSVTVSVIKGLVYTAVVCCLSFFTIFGFFDFWPGVIPIANDLFSFSKGDNRITVSLDEGMTTGEVAELLAEKGIIDEPRVFKFYVKYKYDESVGIDKQDPGGSAVRLAKEFCRTMFTGDGEDEEDGADIKYLSGERTLSTKMNYDQLLYALTTEKYRREQVTVTVPEGYTTQQIISLLLSEGIGTKEGFVYAVNEYPFKHEFVELLTEQSWKRSRIFRLEGYLYPDTYVFYRDTSEVAAINKMLNNFSKRVWDEYYTTYKPVCEAEGVTFDEMMTLASIVQAEGRTPADFENVSQVFHNRRDSGVEEFKKLESCATIQYAMDCGNAEKGLDVPRKPVLSGEDLKYDSFYNTYIYEGLPPGAICNPGFDAIEAAMYPDLSAQVKEEFGITTAYYFNSDITGRMYYSQTPRQHEANVKKAEKRNAEIAAGGTG